MVKIGRHEEIIAESMERLNMIKGDRPLSRAGNKGAQCISKAKASSHSSLLAIFDFSSTSLVPSLLYSPSPPSVASREFDALTTLHRRLQIWPESLQGSTAASRYLTSHWI
ncbi:hypothetical protein FRB94_009224 [Tulasnella sp. JGI-2019a]|nr:hypothetical protein FRB94_009224 [Tulasnella sp. JGI-2019a]